MQIEVNDDLLRNVIQIVFGAIGTSLIYALKRFRKAEKNINLIFGRLRTLERTAITLQDKTLEPSASGDPARSE